MSLLSDEFYENLAKTPRMTGHRTTPQPAPEVQSEKALGEKAEKYLSQPMLKTQEKYLSKVPDISPEEQTAKFGGVVGSPEYQKYQAERSILGRMPGEIFSTLGANLPEQEKWDKMSTADKLLYVSGHALPGAAANFLIKLPRQIITAPIRIGYSAYKDFSTLYGLRGDNKTELNLPVLGTVPTYFKSYDDARKSGQDVLTAAVSTIALAAGDLAISIQGAQALKSVTSPRKVIEGSPTITDAQPIKNAIIQNEFGLKSVKQQVAGSPNKYYQLPGDIAKQYNKGNPNNTFMKISPIDMEGNFELAIVQVRGGVIPKIIDKIRGQKLSQGDFGPEMKFTSDKIPLGKINPKAFADWQNEFATTSKEVGWMGGKDKVITEKNYSEIRKEINKAPSVEQNILDAEIRLNELVKQEAEMMRDIQKEVGGVSLIGERGGALTRASSNPQWYRDFYKENKRAPSKKIILELAKEELEKGSGMFSKEYQGIKSLVEDLKKSDDIAVFRGGEKFDVKKVNGEVSVSLDKDIAKNYGNVEELFIDKNARIATPNDLPEIKFKDIGKDYYKIYDTEKAIELAKRKGFDGINIDSFEEHAGLPKGVSNAEIKIFNPDIIKTKVQIEGLSKTKLVEKPTTPEMPEGYGVSTEQPSLREFTPRSKPLPGMENNIITTNEMRHLDTIIKYTKMDPELAKIVIKAVTGKDVMGELTHGEYIKAQNALSLFENSKRYLGPEPNINPTMLDLKSAKPAFQNMQNKLGVPVYEEIFIRMENAMKALKRFKEKEYPEQADLYKITGGKKTTDYGSADYANKRRLAMAYGEKYSDAISKNTLLSPKEKIDLLEIAKRTKAKLDEYADLVGMKREERIQDYMPHIKNRGGIFDIEKAGSGFPGESTPFFEYQRGGSLESVVDDPLALLNIYASALGKKLLLSENLGKMKAVYDSIPKNNLIEKEYVLDYVQTRLGYIGKTEAYLNKWAAGVNRKLGINLPPDFARKFMQVEMDTIYSGAMGANPVSAVRNVVGQLPLVLARTGTEDLAWAFKMSRSKAGMAEVAEKGFLTEHGGVYGIDLAKEAELTGKIGSNYRKVTQGSLSLISKSDTAVRNLTYFLSKAKWNRAMEKINSGKISWEQWEKEVDLGSMNPIDQQIVRKALAEGKHEVAFDHITRDIIDSTNFHYRSANSPRWMWETKGKQLGMFAQYPIEYVQTLGHWLKTGQYDKFIKFYGISTGFKRTAEDTFGMDISKWMNLGPMAVGMTPVLKFFYETLMAGVSYLNDNPEEFDKHEDAIVKEISNLGIPMGVQGNRVYDFQRDISQSKKDNLPIGTYGVYDRQGKLIYKTNFSGLFSGVLLGFPTKEKMQESETLKNMMNSRWESSDAKKTMMKLLRDGKTDEATKIMVEFGVVPTQQDYDSYYIPRNQRIWNTLPRAKKPQFIPQVFK